MEEKFEKNVKKKKRRRNKKIRSLIVLCTFTAIFCGVSTYAWFIGMRSVAVSSFDVEIATTDSLLLSLDGKKWATQVNIDKSNYNDTDVVYADNTNSFLSIYGISIRTDDKKFWYWGDYNWLERSKVDQYNPIPDYIKELV